MKVTDAADIFRAAAIDMAGMSLEMATAIHANTAGKAQRDVKPDTWADLRLTAVDPDDLAALDKPVQALQDAIAAIRVAFTAG